MARTVSVLSRASTSGGVPAGASSPIQASDSSCGKPSSATLGTSGASALRLSAVTASAFILPAFTCGSTPGMIANMAWMFPASISVTAGGKPR